MIEIENLYKYYGDRRAVGPVSISIGAGEVVGLLGLNGAGKTTTLRILACDLLPSSGSVKVQGLDVVERPDEVRSLIGYLPDTPPLYAEMAVHDYLVFAARLRGLSSADAEKRAGEVEEATDLVAVKDDPIASLSHGFRQRVGIAQAIVHRPKLLVLDEPISGLDPVQIVEMRTLLKSLAGEHTIIVSSHILSEISETCDRILVIREGEIAASGTEAELSGKLLGGGLAVVTVRGDVEAGQAAAAKVEGVREVVVGEAPEAELSGAVTLTVEADRDVRGPLCKALVEAGLDVLELRREGKELESVFLRLAGDRPERLATAKAKAKKPRTSGAKPKAEPSAAPEEKEAEA